MTVEEISKKNEEWWGWEVGSLEEMAMWNPGQEFYGAITGQQTGGGSI